LNRRSLHSATPDFLLGLVALANFMRLSLLKAAYVAIVNAARQEIRYALSKNISKKGPRNCRSLGCARDDKGEGDASIESGYWTEGVFHLVGWAAGP
jgi:hypothetical protein